MMKCYDTACAEAKKRGYTNPPVLFRMNEDDIDRHPFIDEDPDTVLFYRFLFEILTGRTFETECGSMDCTRISVSRSIIDAWYANWMYAGNDSAGLSMMIALSGPKSPEDLPDGMVLLEPGAIVLRDGKEWY